MLYAVYKLVDSKFVCVIRGATKKEAERMRADAERVPGKVVVTAVRNTTRGTYGRRRIG